MEVKSMKLDWKGNQRRGENIGKATIRKIDFPIKMSIYKYVGCGDALFFTCHEFGINQMDLHTEDWDEAENRVLRILKNKCDELVKKVDQLLE